MLRKGRLGRMVQLGKVAAGLAGDFAGKADILTSSLGEKFHVQAAERLGR